jgi:PKD domain
MVTKKGKIMITCVIIAIFFICLIVSINSDHKTELSASSYLTPMGVISISNNLPKSPENVIRYWVFPQENDMVEYSIPDRGKPQRTIPSETEAPQIAQKILSKYGGIPNDGILGSINSEYVYTYNFVTKKDLPSDPISTDVGYIRKLDGIPVIGNGGFIQLELGENGKLLYLKKIWRTVNSSGTIRIIPITVALDKLQRGETLSDRPKCACELNVNSTHLGYFEKGYNITQDFLDPVWIFSGTLSDGDSWSYTVYAWQFANFTAIPLHGSDLLKIQFNDTSETKPVKWKWDFGDGTASTEQSPEHYYEKAGAYNITLTAWNDLGSNTVTKKIMAGDNLGEIPALNSSSNTTPGTRGISNNSN